MLTWLGQPLADHESLSPQIARATPDRRQYNLISGIFKSIKGHGIQLGIPCPRFWCHLSLMSKNSGSVAVTLSQAQRRSNRANRGCNGRDVQLSQLGEQLTAPTRTAKKRFAPDEGMQLEVNVRAPAPKKRRTKVGHKIKSWGSRHGN